MKAGNFLNSLETFIFWHLTSYFLSEENYRLIHLHEEKHELWLENPAQKDRPVIRIQMKELSWSNVIERDINHTFHIVENLRKQMGRMKLFLANIYISPFEPVGDTSSFFIKPITKKNGKLAIQNLLLTSENLKPQLENIEKRLGVKNGSFSIPDKVTEEMVTKERDSVIRYITAKVNEEQQSARKEKPLVTYTFLAMQILAFIFIFLQDRALSTYTLVKWGAMFNPLVYEGEWWRFISPVLLHVNFMHIASNCIMLYVIGPWAEGAFGKWRYFFILLFGGIAGNIASFAFNPESVSVGSSTALFAVFGALLYLVVRRPHIYAKTIGTSIAALVVVNLIIDIFSPNISLSGHVGGLVGGFFIAGTLSLKKHYFHWRQLMYGISSFILVVLFVFVGLDKIDEPIRPSATNAIAQSYLQDGKPKEANKLVRYLEISDSADENTYTLRASEAIKQKDFYHAAQFAKKANDIDPSMAYPYYVLALYKLNTGNKAAARIEAKKAAELSDDPIYREFYARLMQENNR
ncbi:rhomboid family intramembrane serine protease [Listeria sp. PSOL-1]|uniref:rhomboid family protein n=1 Tax=Listeria sp. PSOL-1 TaxID=1844999 RepID=UPI001E3F5A64|nr:rhomboid family intramembrane serine protease [Listeria sp. PSOL-1]